MGCVWLERKWGRMRKGTNAVTIGDPVKTSKELVPTVSAVKKIHSTSSEAGPNLRPSSFFPNLFLLPERA